jgi:outer membrane protein assembly factor BamB
MRRVMIAALLVLAWAAGRMPPPDAAYAVPAPPAARDWPTFGGTPQRNMVNLREHGLPVSWSVKEKRHNLLWEAKLGSRAYGGPTVAGGKIYVGTNNGSPRNRRDLRPRKDDKNEPADKGVVMCFEEATGRFLWQSVHDKLSSGQVNDWPNEGVGSMPPVDGDRVYYVSNRCELVCVTTGGLAAGNVGVQDEKYQDATDADVVWRLDMLNDLKVFPHNLAACSPLVVGDLVFVVTGNGVDEGHINIPAPDAPSFLAVHKKTGKVVWQDSSPGKNIMHGQWGNPSYTEAGGRPQVLFPGGDGWLYAFDPPTGRLLWKFDGNPKGTKHVLGGRSTKSDFVSVAPAVHDGRVYVGTGEDPEHFEGIGHLWCIDLERAARFGATNPGCDVSPVNNDFDPDSPANKTSALVWHYGGKEKDRKKAGRDYVFGRTLSTCAVHDGLCYAAELAGYLHCVDAKTGQRYWTHDLKGAVWGSPLWADGKVYLATEDGDVFVFEHGKANKLLALIEMEQPIRSTIVAANGVLYVMTESYLHALKQQ